MADRDLQAILNSGEITNINVGGVTSGDKLLTNDEITAEIALPKDVIKLTPTLTPPAYTEGQMFYDDNNGTMRIQGPFSDVTVGIGHDTHLHVFNDTGATINKGQALQYTGVTGGGIPTVALAIADTFDGARILGVASADILNNTEGAATTFGEIENVDMSAYTAGVPLYLSDTVAGAYTTTPPDIITRVGGVTVSAASGTLIVAIINNKSLPNIFAGLQGQVSPTYAVTTTAQDVINYSTLENIVMSGSTAAGTVTTSDDGGYRMDFTAAISFPSATSTRTVYFEFYDSTNATIIYTHPKNIPRDATEDGVSFNYPLNTLASTAFKMRIRSSVSISVTFDDISFDLQSVNLR
jgi:hypothetical protein